MFDFWQAISCLTALCGAVMEFCGYVSTVGNFHSVLSWAATRLLRYGAVSYFVVRKINPPTVGQFNFYDSSKWIFITWLINGKNPTIYFWTIYDRLVSTYLQ